MSQINESLIEKVFQQMLEYKPGLQKYMYDEDDEDEDVDIRLLADQIVKNFPWPIGVELRRLFSGSMRFHDRGRLDQLLKTMERTMQFLSFIMVMELYDQIDKNKLKIDPGFMEQFEKRFQVLTLGNFTWMIRAIGKILGDSGNPTFVAELDSINSKSFFKEIDFWVPERNEIGHYQINLNDVEIEKRCVEYLDRLTNILCRISFLIKYKLVTIREIRVLKSRKSEPKFEHWMDILNSSDSDFKSKEEIYDEFADSNSVLLMKSIKDPSQYLNLSPLIIDTNNETIDSRDKFQLRKDIFLYSRFSENKLFYAGTEVTEKCDLSLLSNYEELVTEFTELMNTITQKQIA